MKKTLSILLTCIMLLSMLPMATFAAEANSPSLTIDSVDATPGDTASVNINLKNNPGIVAATINVSFDEGLTLVGAANGSVFPPTMQFVPPKQLSTVGSITGSCNFQWNGTDIDDADIKDGVILTLNFRISEDAEIGDVYNVTVSSNEINIVDKNLQTVKLDDVQGKVTIIDYTPGDVNDDGSISMLDTVMISRYIVDGCTYDPDGYAIRLNEKAADVNDDGSISMLDVVMISRYIVDGCKTDPNGYNIELKGSTKKCQHEMQAFEAKDATCTENGNIAYWYCSLCDKYFTDVNGSRVITLEDTVIAAKGHTPVVDPAVEATVDSEGLTEGSHCSECLEVFVPQIVIPKLVPKTHSIIFNVSNGHSYLASQSIENPNQTTFSEDDTITLKSLSVPGYRFLGWFDGAGDGEGSGADQVKKIEAGTTEDVELFAHWKPITYTVTFDSPLAPVDSRTYTVNTGLTLTNPVIGGYNFTGWCDSEEKLVTAIPEGTTGNITLYANWTSKRNQTRPVTRLADPTIFEDTGNGQILFAYEIGTIENVPLGSLVKDENGNDQVYQSVNGMKQVFTTSETTSITESNAKTIANAVSYATTNSSAWSLSEQWNDAITVNEAYAEQNGWSNEEAESHSKTNSDTYSLNSSSGGASTTVTNTGLSGTLSANTSNTLGGSASHTSERGSEYDVKDKASMGSELYSEIGVEGFGKAGGKISTSIDKEETEKSYEKSSDSVSLNYSATGTRGSSVTGSQSQSTTGTASWNTSSGYSSSKTVSETASVKKVLSGVISSTKNYGSSYAVGGSNNSSQQFSNSESSNTQYSTALTYSSAVTRTNTKTIELGGEKEGYYRFVLAGTAHVFAIVGYDIAEHAYYTFTYTIMDDNTYTFIDFSSTTPNFDDSENGVLSFEVPYFVNQYVSLRIANTEGLQINTRTGMIDGYTGSDTIVLVPSYMSVDDIDGNGNSGFVKVSGISANAFSGKEDLVAVILSNFITEIPEGAFAGCSSLQEVLCPGATTIGSSAFNGCTSLREYTVPMEVEALGTNAFGSVPKVIVSASAKEIAANAVNSGASEIVLNISALDHDAAGSEYTVTSGTNYFELQGGNKTYENLKITSSATSTYLNGVNIDDCNRIPLNINSSELTLNGVNITCPGYAMLLSSDTTNIKLRQESTLVSTSGNAIVCKNLNISPVSSGVTSVLNVSGNIYVYGEIVGQEYLNVTNGSIIHISKDEYDKYIQGSFNIILDPNGGECEQDYIVAYYGSSIGQLPVPTREYYTFDGWYTESGELVTSTSIFARTENLNLVAHWTLNSFLVTFDANGGSSDTEFLRGYCGEALGVLPTPSRTGFSFEGWYTDPTDGTKVTATSVYTVAEDFTVYARWNCNSYAVSWSTGTGYSIAVSRTSSPYANASTGALNNGAVVYYGDVLSVSYSASTGYSLTGNGQTSLTVTGNVTASEIYASARVNQYTYNVVYKSSNGTSLGSTTVTHDYGTTYTITPPAKSGYSTPSAQSVTWDSTSAKTITFTYSPSWVGSTTKTGNIGDQFTYSATMEYRNRTSNSVEVRIAWTTTIKAYNYDIYGHKVNASTNAGSSSAQVVNFKSWGSSSNSARSSSGTTGWMKVTLNTTNATTANISYYYYQHNANGTDMYKYNGTPHVEGSWSMNIPAY